MPVPDPLDACSRIVFVIERSAGAGCWTRAGKPYEKERGSIAVEP